MENKVIGLVTILIAVVLFTTLATYVGDISASDEINGKSIASVENESFIFNTQNHSFDEHSSLSSGWRVTDLTAKYKNQTWLEFDGVDNVITLDSDETTSVTFWYKNETSDWIFVTNSSGTLYTDSVSGAPEQFPIFHDGSDYLIGKEGSSDFFNGSIDDFRLYDSTLEQELVDLIFAGGRL